ncbi:hypothetical protein OSTOST_20408 [Ostertagia ostertagi]
MQRNGKNVPRGAGGGRCTARLLPIHLCTSNGNSLEVPSALKPIAEDIQQVANASSSFLGQSVKQTASGLGNMITGTSDIAARAAGLIPFLGGYFENMIGGTGRYFGSYERSAREWNWKHVGRKRVVTGN